MGIKFNKQAKNIIKKFNYKDVFIFFILWYFIISLIHLAGQQTFAYTPVFTNIIKFLFIFSGRFIFLSLIILYLVFLYNTTFQELGLKPSNFKKEIFTGIYLGVFLLAITLIFINLPLSFQNLNSRFNPLFQIQDINSLISSILTISLLFIPNIIIATSELFLLNNIVFEIFNWKFNTIIAIILAGLFYSFLKLTFSPPLILINFIIAIICLYLYLKAKRSLYLSTVFLSLYYSIFICYIYGWNFIKF